MSERIIKQNTDLKSELLSAECGLISSALFGTEFNPDNGTDWKTVYSDLKNQTVETLAGNILNTLPLPEELKKEWKNDCIIHYNKFYNTLIVQDHLVKVLTEHNIKFVILKGSAVSMYYPVPQCRIMGDIDFLVSPDQFDEAFRILLQNGFFDGHSEFPRHEVLLRNGCELEMHKYFSLNGGSKKIKPLDYIFFDGINNAEFKEIEGSRFPVLPPVPNGLVLLQHIKHHLKRSLGLRQITDWMMFVKNELNDELWENEFEAEAKKAGLKPLAITVTRMCQLYFGLDKDIKWCQNTDDELCVQLLEHIISTGNMGCNRSKIKTTTDQNAGTANIFRNLQKNGVMHWEAAQKHKFLRCFAWLYQLIHYISVAIKDKISLKEVVSSLNQIQSSENLFKKLNCSENYIGE